MDLAERIPSRMLRAAYHAQQRGLFHGLLATHAVLRRLAREPLDPHPELEEERQARYRALLARDVANAEAGLYPKRLLFGFPFVEYAKRAPELALDLPRVRRRMAKKHYRDLPRHVDLERYPPYYRRTFHWQSDGYLSAGSARRYDLGVELLFLGTADVMRRMAIPPVTRFAREQHDGARPLRVLDVATGTGRYLAQLVEALPGAEYVALDLSPYYLAYARELLAGRDDVSFVSANAEAMPFRDGWFDVVTSVHLFHELPRNARRNVIRELHRVLRPGGRVVIEDSAQETDSPRLAPVLARFSDEFHEPFHADYVKDDLATMLHEVGFEVVSDEPHMVAKVVVADKPIA